jgi:transposase-like protein
MAMTRRKGVERDAGKERQWRKLVKRQVQSGQSVRAFCRREGVSEPSFYAWRRTIAQRDAEVKPPAASHHRTSAPTTRTKDEKTRTKEAKPSNNQRAFVPMTLIDNARRDTSVVIELADGLSLRLPESISSRRAAELVYALELRGER